MLAFLQLLGTFVANLFRSRRRLEVENIVADAVESILTFWPSTNRLLSDPGGTRP